MNKRIFFLYCIFAMQLNSCQSKQQSTNSTQQSVVGEMKPIINLNTLFGSHRSQIDIALGLPNEEKKHKNKYPCNKIECMKSIYMNGDFEAFYYQNQLIYLTYQVKGKLDKTNLLRGIGLKHDNPKFQNQLTVKWIIPYINGLKDCEVTAFLNANALTVNYIIIKPAFIK